MSLGRANPEAMIETLASECIKLELAPAKNWGKSERRNGKQQAEKANTN